MRKAISVVKLTDTISLAECHDGYSLYDYTRGMNLSMRAKTQTDAFVEAITYYQKRTKYVETKINKMEESLNIFINTISDDVDLYLDE